MAIGVGVIAEDDSDVLVIDALVRKIATKRFWVKSFAGSGCGKILAKSRGWAGVLKTKGCTLLLIVHDLDERQIVQLRADLCRSLAPCPVSKWAIVIPVKELEAWLLADHSAINASFQLKRKVSKINAPEGIMRPKERLRDLIYSHSNHKITYVTSVHNQRIAKHLSIEVLRKRCGSFADLYGFVCDHLVS